MARMGQGRNEGCEQEEREFLTLELSPKIVRDYSCLKQKKDLAPETEFKILRKWREQWLIHYKYSKKQTTHIDAPVCHFLAQRKIRD